jgi:hypothetical protein
MKYVLIATLFLFTIGFQVDLLAQGGRGGLAPQGRGGGQQRGGRGAAEEQGTFELRGLPGGRWHVSASKAGFVTMSFGQRRPFQAGRPIELADAQTMERVDLVLPRGAAITGRLVDEFGTLSHARARRRSGTSWCRARAASRRLASRRRATTGAPSACMG